MTVYYLQRADGAIKIGTARHFPTRLTNLIREHGPLDVLALEEGTYQEEGARHEQFAAHRLDGEWFHPAPELLEHIRSLPDDPDPRPTPPGGGGFVMVPAWLLARRPSGNALLTYCALATFGTFNPGEGTYNECRPSMNRLVAETGFSLNTVRRAIDELLKLGAIERSAPRYDDRGGQLPFVYHVLFGSVAPRPAGGMGGAPTGGRARKPTGGTPGVPPVGDNQEPNTKNQDTKNPSASPRGSRLPEDWKPGENLTLWYRSEFLPNGWNEDARENCRRENEKFRDHWLAAAGASARKKNWDAAWRNWMRRAWERRSPLAPVSAPPSPKPFVQQADEYKATKAEREARFWQAVDGFGEYAKAQGHEVTGKQAVAIVRNLVEQGRLDLDSPNGLSASVPSLYSGYENVITVDAEEVPGS